MPITIDTVPHTTYQVGVNEAGAIVQEKFVNAQTYADAAFTNADVYLNTLATLFASAEMPDTDIAYENAELTLDSTLESKRPEAPAALEIDKPDAPVLGALNSIIIPAITIPAYAIPSLNASHSYTETPYQNDLRDQIIVKIEDWMESGGTGLEAEIEDAIWERARARQELQNERVYVEAETYFSSRGFTLPPGALAGRLTEALKEQVRAENQINYEIAIEQAKLAQNNTQFILTSGIEFDKQEKVLFNEIGNRALQSAKDSITSAVELFSVKIQAFLAELEKPKLEAQVTQIQSEAIKNLNDSTLQKYGVEIEMYKASLETEISIVESTAKVYGYMIAGYEADAQAEKVILDSKIENYRGKIVQNNNQTQLSLKEAELLMQNYLGALSLNIESTKATANISAQLAASALSAVNASASIGDNLSRGIGMQYSHSEQLSNDARLSEHHQYNETGD